MLYCINIYHECLRVTHNLNSVPSFSLTILQKSRQTFSYIFLHCLFDYSNITLPTSTGDQNVLHIINATVLWTICLMSYTMIVYRVTYSYRSYYYPNLIFYLRWFWTKYIRFESKFIDSRRSISYLICLHNSKNL